MDLSKEWRPVSKESQLRNKKEKREPRIQHNRGKKTAKERGRITPEIYQEILARSRWRCERCGKRQPEIWTLEAAHIVWRWKVGQEGMTAEDAMMLCGPQVNAGTCHHWIDSTKAGKEWALNWRGILISQGVRAAYEYSVLSMSIPKV